MMPDKMVQLAPAVAVRRSQITRFWVHSYAKGAHVMVALTDDPEDHSYTLSRHDSEAAAAARIAELVALVNAE